MKFNKHEEVILIDYCNFSKKIKIKEKNFKELSFFDFSKSEDISLFIDLEFNATFNLYFYSLAKSKIKKNIKIHLNQRGDYSKSNLEFFGVAFDSSNIKVEVISKVSDAKNVEINQFIRGLIMSKNSSILGHPILKVKQNVAKVTHSLSIGPISQELLFYLRSKFFNLNDINYMFINSALSKNFSKISKEKCEIINKKIKELIYES